VLLLNAVVYAGAVLAYAAFDRVLVGLVFTVVSAAVAAGILSGAGRFGKRLRYISEFFAQCGRRSTVIPSLLAS
jgi:hypothetical protein